MDKLTEFKILGLNASYHLAGEMNEWRAGLSLQNKAVRCYLAAKSSEQILMWNIARNFSWDLEMEIANLQHGEAMAQDDGNLEYPM